MNLLEIKQLIKKHHWWSEECPGKWAYSYWIIAAVEQQKWFVPGLCSVGFAAYKDSFVYEKTSEEEKTAQYLWLKEKLKIEPDYLVKEHDKWQALKSDVLSQVEKVIANSHDWDKDEVLFNYNALMRKAIDAICWGYFLECVDPYSDNILPKLVEKDLSDLDNSQRAELMSILSTPPIISFVEEQQVERFNLILQFRQNLMSDNVELLNKVKEFKNKWLYFSGNYFGDPPIGEAEIIHGLMDDAEHYSDDELRREIIKIETKIERLKKLQKEYLAKYKLSEELREDFAVLRLFGAYIDERKNTMMRTTCAIWHCMKALERVTGVSMEELEWYTYKEIDCLVDAGNGVDTEMIKSRAKLSVFMTTMENGVVKETIFTGKEAEELLVLLNNYDTKEIQGTVASWPDGLLEKFVGTAQVIFHPAKEKFTKGNILVTTMTRPDFVPLIKNAAAIVTDEGGITCHAAIVSRELGIPCVIGTKKATKVLKSGDKIEINLKDGVIKKL